MTFSFTQEELSYLMMKYGYRNLEAMDVVEFDEEKCEGALFEKGYLSQGQRAIELSNDVRLLLSAWSGIRYTIVREDFISENQAFALLASKDYIITYSSNDEIIELNLCDFDFSIMDSIISNYIDISEKEVYCSSLNISLTSDEFVSLFDKGSSNEEIIKKTGISLNDTIMIRRALSSEESVEFILQDVENNVGCKGSLVNDKEGYVLIKHITYNDASDNQRIVIAKGNRQDIVDSIYII